MQVPELRHQGTIARAEIDSFLAASGRPEFRRRILIDTTGRRWSSVLKETLRHQQIPVQRIGLHDLERSPIDWSKYVASGDIAVQREPKAAWKHQQQAIDSAASHFAERDTRGKLLMACGDRRRRRRARAPAGPQSRPALTDAPSLDR